MSLPLHGIKNKPQIRKIQKETRNSNKNDCWKDRKNSRECSVISSFLKNTQS